jgi:hypothetical protein
MDIEWPSYWVSERAWGCRCPVLAQQHLLDSGEDQLREANKTVTSSDGFETPPPPVEPMIPAPGAGMEMVHAMDE